MSYQSRKKPYRSRREKGDTFTKRLKYALLIVAIALFFIVLKNWSDYWAYLKTYLM